ncbi:hypothetical protein [Flavobacterium sp.]|uniref:hypothetical protein n=1 Tax=Flavobacterium sp. TaxID=239 RepID=UPI00286B4495|nr:hypothetical protein [Flavobacterium sp.]
MKNALFPLICLLFFGFKAKAVNNISGKDLIPITITMNDAQIKKGKVKNKFDPENKIKLIQDDGSEETIASEDIKEFTLSTSLGELRYENVPYYKNRRKDIAKPIFMMVMVHADKVPLAMYCQTPWKEAIGPGAAASMYNVSNYYARRDGEEAATLLSSVMMGQVNPNAVFRYAAPDYFSDYPELAKKIENKTYTYETIMYAAIEYIKWKVGPENMGEIKKN